MPQHRTQRHALLSLGVAFAAANLAVGILYPLAPVLLTGRGGLTEREYGLFFAIASIVGGIAFPVWGLVADGRLGRPRALALALGAGGVLGALALAGPVFLVPLAILAFYAAESGIAPVLDALALDVLHGRTSRYGRLRSAGSGGYAIAAIGATPLIALAGIETLAVVVGGLALVGVAIALRLRVSRVEPGTRPHLRDLVGLPRRAPAYGRLLLVATAGSLPLASMLAWFAPLLRERGFDPGLAAAAAGFTALIEIPVLLLAGRIGERWGWRAPLVWGAALYTVPVGILAMPLDLSMPVLIALRASTGVAFALFMTGSVVMVRELVPPRLVATGQGVLQLVIFGVGPAVAGIVGGLLWPLIGSATLGLFAVGGAVAAVAARLSLPAGQHIHHDRDDRGVEPAVFEPAA